MFGMDCDATKWQVLSLPLAALQKLHSRKRQSGYSVPASWTQTTRVAMPPRGVKVPDDLAAPTGLRDGNRPNRRADD